MGTLLLGTTGSGLGTVESVGVGNKGELLGASGAGLGTVESVGVGNKGARGGQGVYGELCQAHKLEFLR